MITEADIENRYTYHAPKMTQVPTYNEIREAAKVFAYLLLERTPSSREQSLAFTKLDECVMFANAAIARNPDVIKVSSNAER